MKTKKESQFIFLSTPAFKARVKKTADEQETSMSEILRSCFNKCYPKPKNK